MDSKYLDEIKAREQAATSGPWTVGDGTRQSLYHGKNAVVSQSSHYVVADRAVYPDTPKFNEQVYANMDFISHARTDIPALIAEVETLKKALLKSCEFMAENLNCESPLNCCKDCQGDDDCAIHLYEYFLKQAQEGKQ